MHAIRKFVYALLLFLCMQSGPAATHFLCDPADPCNTVELGEPPQGATGIEMTLTALTAGSFEFPDGASASFHALQADTRANTSGYTVSLTPGQHSVAIKSGVGVGPGRRAQAPVGPKAAGQAVRRGCALPGRRADRSADGGNGFDQVFTACQRHLRNSRWTL